MNNFLNGRVASALVAVGFVVFGLASAQAAFIPLNTQSNYFQNFDSLINKGKSTTLPLGWAFQESGGNNQIEADNGGSAAHGVYSYGLLKDDDRALGALRGDGKFGIFGASF